jgi:putative flippase GtrA
MKHPNIAQFLVFFVLSNGMTVLQMALMPIFKAIFGQTALVDTDFQIFHIGQNFNGTPYYMFDYAGGGLDAGGGGGLAYFLSVEITMAIAQVVNFFAQRKITFKANNSVWRSAMWYVLAYIGITFVAAALQGLYKTPVYQLFIDTWNMGKTGETIADIITMFINSAVSFWVFFPIFKLIFKSK